MKNQFMGNHNSVRNDTITVMFSLAGVLSSLQCLRSLNFNSMVNQRGEHFVKLDLISLE